MIQRRRFIDLALDGEGLHTPDGTLPLASITRADVMRNRTRTGGGTTSSSSPAAVVGGALIGGALAGPVGALGGGLLGSTVKRDAANSEGGLPRTTSATLIFESPELAYSTTVGVDRVSEAEAFVAAVKQACGL